MANITRIPATSTALVQEATRGGKPVIVTGFPVFRGGQSWNHEGLVALQGSARIGYRRSPSHVHPHIDATSELAQSTDHVGTLADFLALMSTTPNVLLDANLVRLSARRGSINKDLGGLAAAIQIPPFFSPGAVDTVGMWLSGEGVQTSLHYDRNGRDNFNAQIAGKKEFVLFRPEDGLKLSPLSLTSSLYNHCRVDPFGLDFARCRAFSELDAIRGHLLAGEMLFLPAFWYHAFRHQGTFNFNINFWCDAVDVPVSGVALRNEIAGLVYEATDGRLLNGPLDPWSVFLGRLEAGCMAWAPNRPSMDDMTESRRDKDHG